MTHEKVRYCDCAVIDTLLVCLDLSEITTWAFTAILLASFAPIFLDRANYYYHESYAGLQRVSLSSLWY